MANYPFINTRPNHDHIWSAKSVLLPRIDSFLGIFPLTNMPMIGDTQYSSKAKYQNLPICYSVSALYPDI